jgi:hypothetical protein
MTGRIGVVVWSLARCRVKVLKVCFLRRFALVNDDVLRAYRLNLLTVESTPRRVTLAVRYLLVCNAIAICIVLMNSRDVHLYLFSVAMYLVSKMVTKIFISHYQFIYDHE